MLAVQPEFGTDRLASSDQSLANHLASEHSASSTRQPERLRPEAILFFRRQSQRSSDRDARTRHSVGRKSFKTWTSRQSRSTVAGYQRADGACSGADARGVIDTCYAMLLLLSLLLLSLSLCAHAAQHLVGLHDTNLSGAQDTVLDLPPLNTDVHHDACLELLALGTLFAVQSSLRDLVQGLVAVRVKAFTEAFKLFHTVLGQRLDERLVRQADTVEQRLERRLSFGVNWLRDIRERLVEDIGCLQEGGSKL